MSTDDKTISFYDKNAADYADFAAEEAEHPKLTQFISRLPDTARVLDFGCGIGWAAAALRDKGYDVDAMDASRGLAEEGKRRFDLDIRVAHFRTLSSRSRFDAVWSHFALQHAERRDRPQIFERLSTALKPGGVLYIGVQKGPMEWRDDLGRLYCPFREEDMMDLLSTNGFEEPEFEYGSGTNYDGSPSLGLYTWTRKIA